MSSDNVSNRVTAEDLLVTNEPPTLGAPRRKKSDFTNVVSSLAEGEYLKAPTDKQSVASVRSRVSRIGKDYPERAYHVVEDDSGVFWIHWTRRELEDTEGVDQEAGDPVEV